MKFLHLILIFVFLNVSTSFDHFQENFFEIEMTKAQLLQGKLTINCDYYKNKKLISFKIKTPNNPTVNIYGDSLYIEARKYVKGLNIDDKIILFDIKTETNNPKLKNPSVTITIVKE